MVTKSSTGMLQEQEQYFDFASVRIKYLTSIYQYSLSVYGKIKELYGFVLLSVAKAITGIDK
jgi:hypothetical protein